MEHFQHFDRDCTAIDSDIERPGVYTPRIDESNLNTGLKPEAARRNP